MIISKKFIPSLFTILNAFCGFMSIISSSHSEYEQAVLFIGYAAVFDVLDGLVARILHSSSDFGVELDSLSDVISFGLAPSFLLYNSFFKDYNSLGVLVSSMVMAFSAIRLARFNISLTGYTKDVFYGIPTPMSALILCSYYVFFHDKIFTHNVSEVLIFVLTICVSLLMVSKFRFPIMPSFNTKAIKSHPRDFIILTVGIIIILATKGIALFPLSILYVLLGIITTYIPQKSRKVK
jgi:CDP-diacylglycerol--serine O-phosphatidyltransferase